MLKIYYAKMLRYKYNIINQYYNIKHTLILKHYNKLKKNTPYNSLDYFYVLKSEGAYLSKRVSKLEKMKLTLNKIGELLQ